MKRIDYLPLRFLLESADNGKLSNFNRALLENLSEVADRLLSDSVFIESYQISVYINREKMIYDIGRKLPFLLREFGRCGVSKLLREYTDEFVYSLEALFSLGFKTCKRKVLDNAAAFKDIFED